MGVVAGGSRGAGILSREFSNVLLLTLFETAGEKKTWKKARAKSFNNYNVALQGLRSLCCNAVATVSPPIRIGSQNLGTARDHSSGDF